MARVDSTSSVGPYELPNALPPIAQATARSNVDPYNESSRALPANPARWRSSRSRHSDLSVSALRRASTIAATPFGDGVGASCTGLARVARYAVPFVPAISK